MKQLLFYPAQVVFTSGMLYGYYHFFLRNKKFHGYNRYFLLAAVILSICVPFLNIPIYFNRQQLQPSALLQTLTVISTGKFNEPIDHGSPVNRLTQWLTLNNILKTFYLVLLLIGVVRFMAALIKLKRLTRIYPPVRIEEITFFNTTEKGTPFSFFRLLFWNTKIPMDTEGGQQIFRHELFHIRQKHSYDIIFLEIVSILFWFNPIFYFIRKELKTIHEFLADQYAMKGNDEWKYAELLLMQAFGSPHNRFSHPFFQNQIKRRIAMITSSQKTTGQYFRKLLVLPVAGMLILLFSFKYKPMETGIVHNFPLEQPVTVVIDAGHGSNSGAVAADGTYEGDITLLVARKIKELNKNNRIRIVLTRTTAEEVDLRKRSDFSNAQNPDLFISIHLNNTEESKSAPSDRKTGFDVFISRKNQAFYPENKILASILLNYFSNLYSVEKQIQQQDQGIWVLDNSKCPSALVECGYLSNAKDLAFIKKPGNQEKVALQILQAVEQYIGQKESPDFNERKNKVADTTMPDILLFKNTDGKLIGKIDGKVITEVLTTPVSFGFVTANHDLTVIPKKDAAAFAKKYGALWDEFIRTNLKDNSPVVEKEKSVDPGILFTHPETDPAFPGGEAAWINYLQTNLNANVPVDRAAPAGSYTVWVQFKVATSGEISDIKSLTTPGYGMEEEVLKLFNKGHKWLPALQNGHKVTAYKKQPVTFIVREEPNYNPSSNN